MDFAMRRYAEAAMKFELIFQLLAVALGAAAVFFFSQGNTDGTFVMVVLAAVSFLVSLRIQIKARIAVRKAEKPEPEESDI